MESKNKCWGHYYLSSLEPDRLMGHGFVFGYMYEQDEQAELPKSWPIGALRSFRTSGWVFALRFKLPDLRHDIPAFSSIDEDEIRYALEIAQTVTRMAP